MSEAPPAVVDVVLAAKDGWGVDLLGELCAALSLAGAPHTGVRGPVVEEVEVEITAHAREALETNEEGDGTNDPGGRHQPDRDGGFGSDERLRRETEMEEGVERRRARRGGEGNSGGDVVVGGGHRYCLHPTELRVRRRPRTDRRRVGGDGEDEDSGTSEWGSWRTWTATTVESGSETTEGVDLTEGTGSGSSAAGSATEGKKNKRAHWHKIKKDNRASTFAALLVRQFGRDRLRHGTGVVDVAGGSGELSFELAVRWGVPCTIVDPRGEGVRLTARHKRLLASRAANRALITATWKAASPLARQLAREWEGYSPANASHVKKWFNAELMDHPETAALLLGCSAVVGLHPDQATGSIVDCGLVLKKPWAVVPCCVFPSLFPTRTRPSDGEPVRTTEALVEHLMARAMEVEGEGRSGSGRDGEDGDAGAACGGADDDRSTPGDTSTSALLSSRAPLVPAQRCELPCEGASTAVWWKPPDGSEAHVAHLSRGMGDGEKGKVEGVEGRTGTGTGTSSRTCGREDWPWPAPRTSRTEGLPGPFQLPGKPAA